MLKFERIPQYIYEKYVSWKSDTLYGRKQWLERAKVSEEYYYNDVENTGTTYTAAQVAKIADNTNIPVSINFLHPIINQKLAILAGTKPSMKVVSLDGRAKQQAFILDKVKHGILSSSNSQVEIEETIKDMLIAGMGHLMVVPTDYYRPGIFNLSVVNIPYDEVILDINAKRRTLEDMEGFFVEKAFTLPKLMRLYGDIISQLKDEQGNPVDIGSFTGETWIEGQLTDRQDVTTTTWNSDDRVIVREFYEKVFTTMYMVPNPQTGLTDYMFAEDLEVDQQSLLSTASNQVQDIFIKKTILLGDYCVWTQMLPITDFPLRTTFFEWGGKPYRSYGAMHFTVGMQEAFDKILSIMVLNGILSNNAGWTAPKGTITEEDRKKWEEFGSNPRAIKEYNPKQFGNEVIKPERDQIQQLSNFYPMVLDMLKNGIEYSTGITAILQGDAKEAGIDVFSSLQQYQSAAMMRIQLATARLNEVMREIGQVLVEYIVSGITPDSYQFFDQNGDLNELELALDYVNNMRSYRYQVASIPATALPTQRLAIGSELMKIAQSSPDPAERQILTQKALELSDIREYDDIMEKLDAVKNAQGKLTSLQEAYNRLMETSKQMENKYINIALENKILKQLSDKESKVEAGYAAITTKLEIANKLADAKIKGEQKPSPTA